jgi:hypothetical protein
MSDSTQAASLSTEADHLSRNPDFSRSGVAQNLDISIMLMDYGEILALSGRSEYTIGRVSTGQSILPDIDLGPYLAYEKGVSRLHVLVKIGGGIVSISDLGSVNGTQLNGKVLLPNQPHPLIHGDILTLGKMKLQVLIRN